LTQELEPALEELKRAEVVYTGTRKSINEFEEALSSGRFNRWWEVEVERDYRWLPREEGFYQHLLAKVKYIQRALQWKSKRPEWGDKRFRRDS